jgi:hypothetical protein
MNKTEISEFILMVRATCNQPATTGTSFAPIKTQNQIRRLSGSMTRRVKVIILTTWLHNVILGYVIVNIHQKYPPVNAPKLYLETHFW